MTEPRYKLTDSQLIQQADKVFELARQIIVQIKAPSVDTFPGTPGQASTDKVQALARIDAALAELETFPHNKKALVAQLQRQREQLFLGVEVREPGSTCNIPGSLTGGAA